MAAEPSPISDAASSATRGGLDPILVVGFPALGDFVRCHSAVRILAERFPGHPIDIVTSERSGPVAALMPHVRKTWMLQKSRSWLGLDQHFALGRQLRAEKYKTAYLLSAATKASLIPWLANIPERIGYPQELQFGLINRFPVDWVQRLRTFGLGRKRLYDEICNTVTLSTGPVPDKWPAPQLVVTPAQVDDWRRRNHIDAAQPALALFTSGHDDHRSWPIERFISIARHYLGQGWAIWIVGGGREISAAAMIRASVPEAVDFTSTSLLDAMYQIAAATLYLGVDGGPSHCAGALNAPGIFIFESGKAWANGPIHCEDHILEPPLVTPNRMKTTLGVSEERVLNALEQLRSTLSRQTP